MATITEIAPDIFRISTLVQDFGLQFNQFLVRDDEPLLYHTGMRARFPEIREAVGKILDPAMLRWISFSHFEADECGALNEWLEAAPAAQAACSLVGALVSVNDFATRPARALEDGQVFSTGKYRFRFRRTPHVPHCWEAGMLFEESNATLFSSDLFHQLGEVEPITQADVVGRFREALTESLDGPLSGYMPWTPHTEGILNGLAALKPKTIAAMHGSTFQGDGEQALRDAATMMKEVLSQPAS